MILSLELLDGNFIEFYKLYNKNIKENENLKNLQKTLTNQQEKELFDLINIISNEKIKNKMLKANPDFC